MFPNCEERLFDELEFVLAGEGEFPAARSSIGPTSPMPGKRPEFLVTDTSSNTTDNKKKTLLLVIAISDIIN